MAQTEIYKSVVKGQVVDEFGNPVSRAIVYLETEEDDILAGNKYAAETDSDGRFVVENSSENSSRVRHLFVTSHRVKTALFIVDIPNYNLRRNITKYSGIPLVLNGKEEILDIGNVQLQIRYGNIELLIFGKDGQHFCKSLSCWGKKIYLVIKDEQGRFVAGSGLSIEDTRNFVNLEKGSITIELPTGIWQVELVSDISDLNSIIGSSGKFKVGRNDKIKPVKIVVEGKMICPNL